VTLALLPLAAHDHFDFARFSIVEWALFVLECAITVWVLWLAVKTTLRPGEDAPDHVKNSILGDDDPADLRGPTSPRPTK
jgi:hypothetical protein